MLRRLLIMVWMSGLLCACQPVSPSENALPTLFITDTPSAESLSLTPQTTDIPQVLNFWQPVTGQ
ncbi:MAG TPA: hypothetical protein VHL11_06830, partial [Phototrophicaceae bacterium]|nr:hypothetical protein [Phototrophicaceae bacterium]